MLIRYLRRVNAALLFLGNCRMISHTDIGDGLSKTNALEQVLCLYRQEDRNIRNIHEGPFRGSNDKPYRVAVEA